MALPVLDDPSPEVLAWQLPGGPSRTVPGWLGRASVVPTLAGVVLTAVGFAVLGYSWVKVADETNVALQLPYFLSGGLVGLALVMVGLVTVSIATKRRDAAERASQAQHLAGSLQDLLDALDRVGSAPTRAGRR